MNEYVRENRDHWEEAAKIHPKTDFYDVESFLDGESTLLPIEREELDDVSGTDLLHLQCHFGLDTLSWAREGATVTGVDFATRAVETARELATEAGLDDRASFVEANVYDLPEVHDARYDVVFTSYGVLGWLPDVEAWAEVVAEFLRPGGVFYLAEIHPFTNVLHWEFDGEVGRFEFPYSTADSPITLEGDGTYADAEVDMEHGRTHNWTHGLGEILTALLDAGLELEFVHEHDVGCFEQFDGMVKDGDGYWRFEADVDVPLTVSVKARQSE